MRGSSGTSQGNSVVQSTVARSLLHAQPLTLAVQEIAAAPLSWIVENIVNH